MKSSQKKIAFFCPQIYPDTVGGMEIFYYYFINEISKHYSTVLITNSRNVTNINCEVIRISSKLFCLRKFNLGKISLILTALYRIFKLHDEISLLHVPFTSNADYYKYIFPLARKVYGIPFIIQIHGGGKGPWNSSKKGSLLLFDQAAKVLAVSERLKFEYEQKIKRKVEVVLPLIPFTSSGKSKTFLRQKYGFLDEDKVCIMVGSIKSIKGNIWVYEEFVSLEKLWIKKHKLKLLFVGNGVDSHTLKVRIRQDHMDQDVRVIDYIPNERINEIYELADCYIIGSDFEGTPKSLLEAMFNGLPVIGTNVKGIDSIIMDMENGLLVEKTQKGQLSHSIKILIEEINLAQYLGTMAKKSFNERYDFQTTIDSFKKIYDNYQVYVSE